MRRLIINADDFGLTEGVCKGIAELMETGAITDTTVMMAVEGAPERAVAFGGREMQGRLGLHLQLTSGRPVSQAGEVPSLVDGAGLFRNRAGLGVPDKDDVALEWARQLELFVEAFRFVPSHLDSHHSVHDVGAFGEIYLTMAAKLGVPVRRGRVIAKAEQRAAYGVKGTDLVFGTWTGSGLGLEGLKAILTEMDGVAELVTHPGYSDEGLRAISSLHAAREEDLLALKQLHSQGWLAGEGITLTSYQEAFA